MSGIDKLLNLLDRDIPECKKRLQDSHTNLEDVAKYCETNYAKAVDKNQALEETKGYMTQSLASVAYQINLMSVNFLQLLDLQVEQVSEMETSINHLSQVVSIHKEKVARREIGELTSSKGFYRPPGLKNNGVVLPEKPEPLIAYVRKPINFNALDNVGLSKTPQPSAAQQKPSQTKQDGSPSLNYSPSNRSSVSKPSVGSKPARLSKAPDVSSPLPVLPPPPPPPELMSSDLPQTPFLPPCFPDSPFLPPPPPAPEDEEDLPHSPPDYDNEDFAEPFVSRMILDESSWVPTDFVEKVVAVYSYAQDKEDELSFDEGAIIYVIHKNEDGWWEGVMDGQRGLFPSNYVEPCI